MSGNWITKKRKEALIVERDNCTCVYCGNKVIFGANMVKGFSKEVIATLDHLTPRNCGGDNSNENLATACMPCNSSRKDMTLEEFVKDADKVYTILQQAQKPCSVQYKGKKVVS